MGNGAPDSADVGASGQATRTTGTRDIETHFTIIAIVELVLAVPAFLLGALILFGSLIGAGFVEAFGDVPGLGALIGGAGILIGLLILAMAVPSVISAVGLLKRESWAKVWTIVVAVLNLLNVPLGTVFGIYAIWVMTRPETDVALG